MRVHALEAITLCLLVGASAACDDVVGAGEDGAAADAHPAPPFDVSQDAPADPLRDGPTDSRPCLYGSVVCAGVCLDPRFDRENCGRCGVRCGAEQECARGRCAPRSALTRCGERWVDTAADPAHCGACGVSCGAATCASGRCECPSGTERCGAACVDTRSSAESCGGCGIACRVGERCEDARCVCPRGASVCGDRCVSITTDRAHCGACGAACADDRQCLGGRCRCAGELTDCAGACADTESDAANCGACGARCEARAHTITRCEAGACAYACESRHADCDGDARNGCEVDLASSAAHCGACGAACAGACTGGLCGPQRWAVTLPELGANELAIHAVAEGAGGTFFLCGSIARSATWRGRAVTANLGGADGIVLAVSPTGDLLWHAPVGGAGHDAVMGCSMDATGDLRVCGTLGGVAGGRGARVFVGAFSRDGVRREGYEVGDGVAFRCGFDRAGNAYAAVAEVSAAPVEAPPFTIVSTAPSGAVRWRSSETFRGGRGQDFAVSPLGGVAVAQWCSQESSICGGGGVRAFDGDGRSLWGRGVRFEGFVTCWGSVSWGTMGRIGFDAAGTLYQSVAAHIGDATFDTGLRCASGSWSDAVCRGERDAGTTGLSLVAISPTGVPSIVGARSGGGGAAPMEWAARNGVAAWQCEGGVCQAYPALGTTATNPRIDVVGAYVTGFVGAVSGGLVVATVTNDPVAPHPGIARAPLRLEAP